MRKHYSEILQIKKSNLTPITCYEEFLDLCSTSKLSDRKLNFDDLLLFDKLVINDPIPFGCSLIDYKFRQFIYLSRNVEEILSYSEDDFKQGIEFLYNKLLPEDQYVYNNLIFPDILNFLLTIDLFNYERYRFSFTYRFYRKNGTIATILQHSNFLEPDPNGRPLLNRVIFSDITYFKPDNEISLAVSYFTKEKNFIPVFKKCYSNNHISCLSNRELEILRLCIEGLSSKQIADKLFLSVNTIKNHKRNMMEKTKTNNISSLIYYALKNCQL